MTYSQMKMPTPKKATMDFKIYLEELENKFEYLFALGDVWEDIQISFLDCEFEKNITSKPRSGYESEFTTPVTKTTKWIVLTRIKTIQLDIRNRSVRLIRTEYMNGGASYESFELDIEGKNNHDRTIKRLEFDDLQLASMLGIPYAAANTLSTIFLDHFDAFNRYFIKNL